MKQKLYLSPLSVSVGLESIAVSLTHALKEKGKNVELIKPFNEEFIWAAAHYLSEGQEDKIHTHMIKLIEESKSDMVIIEGLAHKNEYPFAQKLNQEIANALSAKTILVAKTDQWSLEHTLENIKTTAKSYDYIQGAILNKVGAPIDTHGNTRIDLFDPSFTHSLDEKLIESSAIKIIGVIPWKRSLMGLTVKQIAQQLGAKILNEKDFNNRDVEHMVLAAANLNVASASMNDNVLVITSGDRSDIIIGACMKFLNGTKLSGLLLTAGQIPSRETLDICSKAIKEGLAIIRTETDSLRTSIALQNINMGNGPVSEKLTKYIASKIELDWIENLESKESLSPSAFRYNLIEKAKSLQKSILLPESDDIRIIDAANICAREGIAKIVLLGKKESIEKICREHNTVLDPTVEVRNPNIKEYVAPLHELRKAKGLTEEGAEKWLEDPIVLSMMMLKNNEVDGLVAGANTTTAQVVSPALKILKTAKGAKLVSSIFFMCLKSEVLIYGDCAINQNPTAEGLADIAIQSAESAKKFGIDPKVAMISYSTGSSGVGEDVEKVKQAAAILKEQRPDILSDGPLQYDAAKVPEVAAKKAPDSPVAGKATVFIFPDLNTANTTYKAVQRSALALSIGPMLQGLSKPVNDLSRGATVEDIVYTIAITAVGGS